MLVYDIEILLFKSPHMLSELFIEISPCLAYIGILTEWSNFKEFFKTFFDGNQRPMKLFWLKVHKNVTKLTRGFIMYHLIVSEPLAIAPNQSVHSWATICTRIIWYTQYFVRACMYTRAHLFEMTFYSPQNSITSIVWINKNSVFVAAKGWCFRATICHVCYRFAICYAFFCMHMRHNLLSSTK